MNNARRLAVPVVAAALVVVAGGALALLVSRTDDGGRVHHPSQVRDGGRLRIGSGGLASLDPAAARDPTEVMVADQLFDTLVRFQPDTGAPAPGIAQSWDVSPDQKTFVFHLRDDVQFHDGSPVTATDVKATLDRIARQASVSDFRFQFQVVSGYGPWHLEGKNAGLSGVQVVDPHTVSVVLDQPFSQFPLVLGNPGFGIVPAAAAGVESFGQLPTGSGPFRFEARDGDVVRLVRFDGYRPAPAHLERIVLRLERSAAAAYDDLEEGLLDVAPVPAERVEAAADRFGEGGLRPFLGVLFYGMDLASPKFSDVRFRHAIVAAVDRRRIVDLVYGNTVLPGAGLLPEGVPEAGEQDCGEPCAFDRSTARRLLTEAFPQGGVPTVGIDYDSDPVQEKIAAAIKADLEEVGIPAVLRPRDFADYGSFLVDGSPELFRLGWIADYPSADAFLQPLFLSGEENNLTAVSNPDVDARLRAARAEPDPAKRADLYRQAEQLVLQQYVVIPIAQFETRWAAGEGVGGFTMSPLGTFDGTAVFLASGHGG